MILCNYKVLVENFTPSKTFLNPYVFDIYHQIFNEFQNIQDNVLFTVFVNKKTKLSSFQPSLFNKDIAHVYANFLQNILLEHPNNADFAYAQFLHQISSVSKINAHLGILQETTTSITNNFPQKDPVGHIEGGLYHLSPCDLFEAKLAL